MNRIERILSERAAEGGGSLMPFLVGGYPAGASTGDLLLAVERGGGQIAEVGIPFTDPVADGPVIASAMHSALRSGASPGRVLDEIAAVRDRLSIGVVCMVSASIAGRHGRADAFIQRAVDRGVDGFIFPDVTLEESEPYRHAAAASRATCSLLIAPTTPPDRAAAIAGASTGFVYVVARSGITGERSAPAEVGPRIADLRGSTALPLAVGFGISTPGQVRRVLDDGADAAIVGSALVRRLAGLPPGAAADETERFVRSLAGGLDRGPDRRPDGRPDGPGPV